MECFKNVKKNASKNLLSKTNSLLKTATEKKNRVVNRVVWFYWHTSIFSCRGMYCGTFACFFPSEF